MNTIYAHMKKPEGLKTWQQDTDMQKMQTGMYSS